MKFTIEKSELFSLATIAQKAAASRDTVPILSGVLIEADPEKGLIFTATDLETGIQTITEKVEITESGKALVNARYFADLVRYLPDGEVMVNYIEEKAKLTVQYKKSKTDLNTYNYQDFPLLNLEKKIPYVTIEQKILKDALKKTSFAAAATHFRQVFTGTLFDCHDNKMVLVASDTHRLACKIVEMAANIDNSKQFIIPNRTVSELMRLLEDNDEIVEIGFIDNNVVFKLGETHFTSRLLEGQYPGYQQVIPQNFIATVNIDPAVLVDVLERAVLMPTDDKTIKKVQMVFGKEEIIVTSYSEKMGEMKEFIEGHELSGQEDIKVAFNTRYMLDVFKMLQSETDKIVLQLTGSLSPALVTSPEINDYKYVLVPLRTA
ncbi:MAG: DNA polymerase III subunit beta [Methylocystaceae bacterium]